MAKSIIICCDGTWNSPSSPNATNVLNMARSVALTDRADRPQIVFYENGVGTGNWFDRFVGGAFGLGLDKNVENAYRFLVHNHEPDDEIYIFGFSRGAYTARSLVGLIRNCGLLEKSHSVEIGEALDIYRSRKPGNHPDSSDAVDFRNRHARAGEVKIAFLGLWDTVGSLGVPGGWLGWLRRRRHGFHDVRLSSMVLNAYHALAFDEHRKPFKPSIWDTLPANEGDSNVKADQVVEQVWFAGAHSDVGGGYKENGLSDLAFDWMKQKAESCGLRFDDSVVKKVTTPNYLDEVHNSRSLMYRPIPNYNRPIGVTDSTRGDHRGTESVHRAVEMRTGSDKVSYNPKEISVYLDSPSKMIAEPDWTPDQAE